MARDLCTENYKTSVGRRSKKTTGPHVAGAAYKDLQSEDNPYNVQEHFGLSVSQRWRNPYLKMQMKSKRPGIPIGT